MEIPTTRLENDLGGELVRTSQGARKVQSTGHAMRQSVRLLNRPAYRCRRRCFMPTGRYHLHDTLQSHRLPFWFGLAGSVSDTVRCRRGQLYLGMPDTYPCRAARLSRWSGGTKSNRSPLSQGSGLSPLVVTPRARLAYPACAVPVALRMASVPVVQRAWPTTFASAVVLRGRA